MNVSWIQACEKLANDYLSLCKVFYEESIEDAVWRTLIFSASQLTHQPGTDDISESHGVFVEDAELFLTGTRFLGELSSSQLKEPKLSSNPFNRRRQIRELKCHENAREEWTTHLDSLLDPVQPFNSG